MFQAMWFATGSAWMALDLSLTQLKSLIMISLRGPQAVGQLAAALDITEPSASQLVDRLAHRGLVQRDPDPADRRRIVVTVSAAGELLLDSVRAQRASATEDLLTQLDENALRALAKGVTALADAAGAPAAAAAVCAGAVRSPSAAVAGAVGSASTAAADDRGSA